MAPHDCIMSFGIGVSSSGGHADIMIAHIPGASKGSTGLGFSGARYDDQTCGRL